MPLNNIIQTISPADKGQNYAGSYSRNGIRMGPFTFWHWMGVAIVPRNSAATELDIITPSLARAQADRVGLVIPPASVVLMVTLQAVSDITMGVAGGRLKFAPTLGHADNSQFVESVAATGTNLPRDTVPQERFTAIGAGGVAALITTPTTWKLFATNGGAGAAATQSTMRSAGQKDARVLVSVGGYTFPNAPTDSDVGLTSLEIQR